MLGSGAAWATRARCSLAGSPGSEWLTDASLLHLALVRSAYHSASRWCCRAAVGRTVDLVQHDGGDLDGPSAKTRARIMSFCPVVASRMVGDAGLQKVVLGASLAGLARWSC